MTYYTSYKKVIRLLSAASNKTFDMRQQYFRSNEINNDCILNLPPSNSSTDVEINHHGIPSICEIDSAITHLTFQVWVQIELDHF
mmetsp:Transcript_16261/g.23952  ORF Transcript_16261/g.23952 Transcript_16261/m.23952 type:complete len:85 (+) Transcript_16261:41-295(+)